jgi:hypothetical protein
MTNDLKYERKFFFTLNQRLESMGIENERDLKQIPEEESDVDIVVKQKREA